MWFIIWVRTLIWVTRRLNVVSKFFRKGEQLQRQLNKCWVTAWVWSFWAQGCIDAVYLQVSTVLPQESKHHPVSHKKWKYWKDLIVKPPLGSSSPGGPIIVQSKILYLQEHLYGTILTPIKDSTCGNSYPNVKGANHIRTYVICMWKCSHVHTLFCFHLIIHLCETYENVQFACKLMWRVRGNSKVTVHMWHHFLSDVKGWK